MDKNLQLLQLDITPLRREHAPKLLVHMEPAHRVFFGNVAYLFRSTPPPVHPSKAAPFWTDVFVHSPLPWWRFFESLLWHALAIAALVSLSKYWTPHEHLIQQAISRSQVTYYTPSTSFPALGNSGPSVAPVPREHVDSSRRSPALRVAHQRNQSAALAPKLPNKFRANNIPASDSALPAVPLSAIARSQLTAQAGPNSIVAPPPQIEAGMAARAGLPQAAGIAPAPNIVPLSAGGRTVNRPGMAGVAPPSPTLSTSIRDLGDVNIGASEAVAPTPNLPMREQRTAANARGTMGDGGIQVVPPSPSLSPSGKLGGGRGRSLSGELSGDSSGRNSGVVPPAPSASETGSGPGNSVAGRRGNLLSGAGSQVVAPAPSVDSAGGSSGFGASRAGSLSPGNSEIVPPTPSAAGMGGERAGSGTSNSLSDAGQAVPPAPSMSGGSGANSGGKAASLDAGSQVVPPSPSSTEANKSSAADRPADAVAQPPAAKDKPHPVPEELSLRLIGLVLALPNSSYFSNYEVFIAERRVGKEEPQFIKLVYEYLPYQRALSQYGQNSSKIFKLRVTRDSTCDESLLQMTWPENDPHPKGSADSPGLSAEDRNNMLPCFRTTADDYRKAISRRH